MASDPAGLLAMVILAALVLYALLGGADYGGGVWNLLAAGPRAEDQRKVIARAIGPVWEPNHVWLILVLVLLFTAFPPAFAAVMTDLHAPLSLLAVAIVLRGSAFTFRSYDNTELGRRLWNRYFSIPSVLAPLLLGMVIGANATGRPGGAAPRSTMPFGQVWLGPFPCVVGLFTLVLFAYLAAVYLTLETDDPVLRDDFRARALITSVLAGVLALLVYRLARTEAPLIFAGLGSSGWGFPVRVVTGVFAVLALAALYLRWFQVARAAAMFQVALVLVGCGLAQAPYLVPPRWTVASAAAPRVTLRLVIGALGAGSIVLFPSIALLFRIFKSHTLPRHRVGRSTPAAHDGPASPPPA